MLLYSCWLIFISCLYHLFCHHSCDALQSALVFKVTLSDRLPTPAAVVVSPPVYIHASWRVHSLGRCPNKTQLFLRCDLVYSWSNQLNEIRKDSHFILADKRGAVHFMVALLHLMLLLEWLRPFCILCYMLWPCTCGLLLLSGASDLDGLVQSVRELRDCFCNLTVLLVVCGLNLECMKCHTSVYKHWCKKNYFCLFTCISLHLYFQAQMWNKLFLDRKSVV